MPRFPIAARDKVPPDQVAAFDAIVSSRGGAVPEFGPIAVQLHVPEIAQRGEVLRAYLRAEGSTLPDNVAELAMITTARELDCQFIWHAHAAAGRRAGLNDALVDALRDKLGVTGVVVSRIGRSQLRTGVFPHEASIASYIRRCTGGVWRARFDRTHQSDGLLLGAGVQH